MAAWRGSSLLCASDRAAIAEIAGAHQQVSSCSTEGRLLQRTSGRLGSTTPIGFWSYVFGGSPPSDNSSLALAEFKAHEAPKTAAALHSRAGGPSPMTAVWSLRDSRQHVIISPGVKLHAHYETAPGSALPHRLQRLNCTNRQPLLSSM